MTKLCCFNQDNPNFSAFERHVELATSKAMTDTGHILWNSLLSAWSAQYRIIVGFVELGSHVLGCLCLLLINEPDDMRHLSLIACVCVVWARIFCCRTCLRRAWWKETFMNADRIRQSRTADVRHSVRPAFQHILAVGYRP